MGSAWWVFLKELRDALRDRRTLFVVLLSSVALGPLVLVALSALVSGMERRAEAREVLMDTVAHAPTLVNHLQRQTFQVRDAPPDYEQRLRERTLGDPVLIVPADFEDQLQRGEMPVVTLVGSSGNTRAQAGLARLDRAVQAFNQEQARLKLALRGVPPAVLRSVEVEERDVAAPGARAAQLSAMVPYFVLMAVVYGALTAALDTTAGERERGSLEPLLMNPPPRAALVLGKWGAVVCVGLLIAVLSCASFLPAQHLLRSEALAALFRFGIAEAVAFVALLAPVAAVLSAALMAIAIRCRSFKEAQANATVVVMAVSLLPLISLFNQEGEQAWHRLVPALAQVTLMSRVLRGEPLGLQDIVVPTAIAAVLTLGCLVAVARTLRRAALS